MKLKGKPDTSAAAIAERLATQDNACTAHPIFVVQQRERITGIDTQWTDDIAWICDDGEVDPSDPDWIKAEEHYQETGEELWTRTGYIDRWVFVQPFFTRAAAEAYIKANAHRLTDPRIWVDSAYRNPEWQKARALFGKAVKVERDLKALCVALAQAFDSARPDAYADSMEADAWDRARMLLEAKFPSWKSAAAAMQAEHDQRMSDANERLASENDGE